MVIPTSKVGQDAYNRFPTFAHLSYNCISHLMDNNNLIWKLLKHNTPDAWNESNLTMAEKGALIYKGEEDGSLFKVFMDTGLPDVWTTQGTILRVSPITVMPKNRTVSVIGMCFEAYAHYKINTLSNYTTRVDVIIQQILETMNGVEVGGLGKMFFDGLRDQSDRLYDAGKIPFKGKKVYLSTNEA